MLTRRTFCGTLAALAAPPVENRTYLDNGRVRVGCDLSLGGAITFLSAAGRPNMVNSWDLGRQIQMSYYSGPAPLIVAGKKPAPMWAALGWNPVQSGDHYRNPSRLLSHTNDGKTIHVRCTPMLWTHDAVPAECTFEAWVRLDGPAVRVKCRLTNRRKDRTLYPARDQEMPAVYLNARYHRLLNYFGESPGTGDGKIGEVVKDPASRGPWTYFSGTENWAALVDDDDFGVLVHNPDCVRFVGGFAGKPGKGGPRDSATGYVAPIARVLLDHDITHDYAYTLVVGDLAKSRKWLRLKEPSPPSYRFASTREGWTHNGVLDAGWPIRKELRLKLAGSAPELIGPDSFWLSDAPRVGIEMALTTKAKQARLYWKTREDETFDAKRSLPFAIVGDGKYRRYVVDLPREDNYEYPITQIRIDPIVGGAKGDEVRVRRIGFEKR